MSRAAALNRSVLEVNMSLFTFGFRRSSETGNESQIASNRPVPTYLPEQVESGLGRKEHDLVTTAVEDLANPEPKPKKTKTRGKYATYSDEQRAAIGKYASENGPERQESDLLLNFQLSMKALYDISRHFTNRK